MRNTYFIAIRLRTASMEPRPSAALNALKGGRHKVDPLDLYAEIFQPADGDERRHYFKSPRNQAGLEAYVERLKGAEILLVQFPTWCFGTPAMLKGFFDRLLIPGAAFSMSGEAGSKPTLDNLRRIVGVVAYGQPWSAAFGWATRRARRSPDFYPGSPTARQSRILCV